MPMIAGWLVWFAGTLAGWPAVTDGQEFRVDTEVFFNQEKLPGLETLTIFAEGKVFDFLLTEPRETVILDPQRGRFTLLNEAEQVKATVTTHDLMQYTLELEAQAAGVKDTVVAFAAKPQFETKFEDIQQNGQTLVRLTLAGKPLEYVALGQTPEGDQREAAARMYRHFADWYARLNATRSANLPPAARLVLNQTLAERGLLPLEITRTITPDGPLARKDEVKSRHLVNWTLSGEDRKKIERAGSSAATFKPVSYDEYRRGFAKTAKTAKAAPPKQAKR
jgi:hypothetical protein